MSVQFKTVDEFAVGQRLDNYLLKHLKGVPKYKILSVNNFLRLSEVLLSFDSATRIGGIRTTSSIFNL
jgi:23S rRNA pseudouridine955/2504/2580 synthase